MYNEEQDAVLVEKAQAGDQQAFSVLVARHQGALYLLARNLVSSTEDAEDIAAETFVKAWRHIRSFRSDAAVKTWLCRILINLCRSHLRRRYLQKRFFFWRKFTGDGEDRIEETEWIDPSPHADPQHCSELKNIRQVVRWTRDGLSAREQEVFTLKYDKDMKISEIAALLFLSPNTVKVLLFRATRKMAAALKDYRQ